ncbi:UPF0575 protein C19orf67 homolog [Salarias fasciatus]|uniref:UPF0575 protein C19orf67 homolog n=1 Tax=Salarias fasciatus TaxID=181472 RepID=UPI001176CD46|nr:UPF0575 protein C19orf67 homolog [Salarias fasciatus]
MEMDTSPPGTEQQEAAEASGSSAPQQASSVTALAPSPAPSLECLSPSPGPSWVDDALMKKLQAVNERLLVLLSQSKTIQETVKRRSYRDKDLVTRAARKLLSNSLTFFNSVESSARNTTSQHLPVEICSKCRVVSQNLKKHHASTGPCLCLCVQLLKFSQQLCDSMEQLLLTCADENLFSVDESDPLGLSHFCIGSSQLGQLRVTSFRYCKLSPYSTQMNTGLFKRMRWNVERLREQQRKAESEEQKKEEGEQQQQVKRQPLYFLCYEDVIEEEGIVESKGNAAGQWSIGRWGQVLPDPDAETTFYWILCGVSLGQYVKLVDLGRDEPSSSSATDYMHQLLLSQTQHQ